MTGSTDTPDILKADLKDLPVDEGFYLRSKLMGFHTLEDIVHTPAEVMVKKEEFNYRWLGDLSRLLISQNLLHLLQPTPGSKIC